MRHWLLSCVLAAGATAGFVAAVGAAKDGEIARAVVEGRSRVVVRRGGVHAPAHVVLTAGVGDVGVGDVVPRDHIHAADDLRHAAAVLARRRRDEVEGVRVGAAVDAAAAVVDRRAGHVVRRVGAGAPADHEDTRGDVDVGGGDAVHHRRRIVVGGLRDRAAGVVELPSRQRADGRRGELAPPIVEAR